MRVPTERGLAQPADFAFYAADIGDDGARRQMRDDLQHERHDLIHRRGDDDKVRFFDSMGGRVSDGVAPGLLAQFKPQLGAASPEHDALRDAPCTGGTRDRTAN